MRIPFISMLIGVAVLLRLSFPTEAAPMRVGGYVVNVEGSIKPSAPLFSVPMNLKASTRLVVHVAPQYATDFGIIPAADLNKWRSGQSPRFLFRVSGRPDSRYITLNAGAYYVVARSLGPVVAENGFSIKIRRFTGTANDNGRIRTFASVQKNSLAIPPGGWNGFIFQAPKNGKLWFEGAFSRGSDRKVEWQIVTEAEYQKLIAGKDHDSLIAGANPKTLGFHYVAVPARYYFLLFNRGAGYSSFTMAREVYR